jgi:hypothetical protein
VIARPLPAPAPERGARSPGWRTARHASAARHARNRRRRYRPIGRIVVALSAVTSLVLVYLALLANVTRLHYEVGKLQHQRALLVEQTVRYEDEIALLDSRDRLAALAASLGLREPHAYAIVVVPPPVRHKPAPAGGVAALLPVVQSIVGAPAK